MKAKPCSIIFNGSKTGYIFTPIRCASIAEALRTAREWGFPYRIYDDNGKLIRRGWLV